MGFIAPFPAMAVNDWSHHFHFNSVVLNQAHYFPWYCSTCKPFKQPPTTAEFHSKCFLECWKTLDVVIHATKCFHNYGAKVDLLKTSCANYSNSIRGLNMTNILKGHDGNPQTLEKKKKNKEKEIRYSLPLEMHTFSHCQNHWVKYQNATCQTNISMKSATHVI